MEFHLFTPGPLCVAAPLQPHNVRFQPRRRMIALAADGCKSLLDRSGITVRHKFAQSEPTIQLQQLARRSTTRMSSPMSGPLD